MCCCSSLSDIFITYIFPVPPWPGKAAALPAAAHKPVSGGHVNIAYVDLDSLNEKIHFIRDKRKELESEQKAIETEWENGYRNLENQKNNFLKKEMPSRNRRPRYSRSHCSGSNNRSTAANNPPTKNSVKKLQIHG